MTHLFALTVPVLFLLSFLFALFKKVKLYDSFTEGVKGAIPLILSIFPYIATVAMLSCLLEVSGLEKTLARFFQPLFSLLGIPEELAPLLFVKPLSGSGAVAILADVYKNYGADSYVGKCASCIFSASETVFYVGAVYFSLCKNKKFPLVIAISIISFFATCIFACFICKTV